MDCLGSHCHDGEDDEDERCSTIIDGPCMCAPSYPYRRLEVEKHERPVKITFYKSDYSDVGKVVMDVERSMIVHDLCKILAQKMEFTTTAFWSLVEIWVDKKAERVLEEHEKMVDVYKEMLKFKRRATVRYVLRQNVSKFDFLVEPVRCRNEGGIICEDPKFFEDNHLVCYIEKSVDESICPVFFSRALMLNDKGWKLVFILLKDRRLYYTDDRDGETRLMELSEMEIRKHFYPLGPRILLEMNTGLRIRTYLLQILTTLQNYISCELVDIDALEEGLMALCESPKNRADMAFFNGAKEIDLRDIPGLVLIGELSKLQIYRVTKSGNPSVENTATNAFLVRPTATPRVRTTEEDTEEAEHLARIPVLPKGVIRCTSLSPNFATTWIALMRLAKYGKQLRENYRAFKNKNEAPAREFGRANVPNPLLNSPLFRRMGCKAHLGERARKKDQDHLALLDFSGGRDSSGFELTGYGSRKDALVLYSFLALPRSSKHYNRGNTLERFSQSIRRNMERYGDDPKNYPSPSVPLEHQPSTSRDTEEQDSSEIAEKARRFGAIKKIFSSKKNKSGKKKKNAGDKVSPDQVEGEELEMQYKEYVSEEKSKNEDVVEEAPQVVELQAEAAASLPTEEEGSTAVFRLPTSEAGNETQPPILERESVRSRVAMDFTGKQGRIVEDPVEANEIALAEGYMWKRRHKIPTRRTVNSKLNENHVDVGIHTMQPWFHSNLTRDQASSLVTRYGEGDGVFIVRPSRTSEGTYVLTYKCQGKLAHQQIVPMIDKERNITVFTLDNGQTKFYDILQLVEFYTVNLGPLMCRLTHYITENANIQNPNVPSPSNAPKYVNVAVNTDITIHSAENVNLLESPSGSSKTTSSHSLSSR